MGIGVVWLLEKIDTYGSMRKAAEVMNLSYAKAFRIIQDAEKGLGLSLIYRRRGGEKRKGAVLTADAELLLQSYEEMQRAIKADAEAHFKSFLEKMAPRLGTRAK